jgi:hypothetical protein
MEITVTESGRKNVDLAKWAEITIEKWKFNIAEKDLVSTGDLLRSFEYTVTGEANGNTALINFAFNYYFRMLEMNVGRGRPVGFSRPRRGIFTSEFLAQVYRLSELLAEMYAYQSAATIAEGIGDGLKGRL